MELSGHEDQARAIATKAERGDDWRGQVGERKDTRVPIDRRVEQVPEIRTENGVTIVPIVEERLVIEKQLFLKEELHIRRDVKTETVEVPVTLRSERAMVERFDANGKPLPEESTS